MLKVFAGVDLGTKCGISVLSGNSMYTHEIQLGTSKKEPMRYVKFRNHVASLLYALLEEYKPDEIVVFYEYVARHLGTKAAHAYGAYRMLLLMTCHELEIKTDYLSVQAIKKIATSNGAAKKNKMIESAKNRFKPDWKLTDNEADSMWISYLGREISNESFETLEVSGPIKAYKRNGLVYSYADFE